MRSPTPSYRLPDSAIAQTPSYPRSSARLLARGADGGVRDLVMTDLADLLRPGDVLVRNTTRVIPARLRAVKDTGGRVEILVLEPTADPARWPALVRPGRRVPAGTTLRLLGSDGEADLAGDSPTLSVGDPAPADTDGSSDGVRYVEFDGGDVLDVLERFGQVPLPPYITQPLADAGRYQTTYADRPGSVAAPTAGLHFDDSVLGPIEEAGVGVVDLDLRVGLGTFRPISSESVEGHRMHAEHYSVPPSTWAACQQAERVVAVGTTTVRALESVARTGSLTDRTELFLQPGDPFEVVGAMVTNFHQPRSSLLVLIEAFIGPGWRALYDHALARGYRFLSFGDACFLERS